MIVIGGGLGGLVTAALGSRHGQVTLFERSEKLGGRFRNISQEGFQLTTGALHMIPHGNTGPLAQLLREAGVSCTIVDSAPWGTFFHEGKEVRFSQIQKELPISKKIAAARMLFEMRHFTGPDKSVEEYLNARWDDPVVHQIARSFLGWSLSCTTADLPARDLYHIVKNTYRYGGPGVPLGGCGGVVSALESVLRQRGVSLHHKKITRICVEAGSAVGVEDEDGTYYADTTIVSDIGIKATCGLIEHGLLEQAYLQDVASIPESGGIKINVSSDSSLISHTGVLLPLGLERVEGVNQVTNIDPSLAPAGKHLVMAHQTLRGKNLRTEVSRGIADLEELFGNSDFDVLCAQSYYGKNPVNRASQGRDVCTFPVNGVFLVGDGSKGCGGIEVDGIALGIIAQRAAMGL